MPDFTKLNSAIADLTAKIEALNAKVVPQPVDDQPAIDSAAAQIEALLAKIPV